MVPHSVYVLTCLQLRCVSCSEASTILLTSGFPGPCSEQAVGQGVWGGGLVTVALARDCCRATKIGRSRRLTHCSLKEGHGREPAQPGGLRVPSHHHKYLQSGQPQVLITLTSLIPTTCGATPLFGTQGQSPRAEIGPPACATWPGHLDPALPCALVLLPSPGNLLIPLAQCSPTRSSSSSFRLYFRASAQLGPLRGGYFGACWLPAAAPDPKGWRGSWGKTTLGCALTFTIQSVPS